MNGLAQIVGSVMLACIPALIWGYVFYAKKPEKRSVIALTFVVGAFAVFPILIYKALWQFFPWINAFKLADYFHEDLIGFTNLIYLPVSVLITFMIVGVIEETIKLLSVKISSDKDINTIDDSIEFFIIAALGFSFTENILYFYNIWIIQGANHLFLPFLFRSSFSTFAHLMFSGILGYYYGVAHFAKPILQEEIRQKRKKWTVYLHKAFNIKSERLFYQEKIIEGLLIAIGLHAIFNVLLELNLTFAIGPFLIAGYASLNYLFKKKDNHIKYNQIYKRIRNHPDPESNVFFLVREISKA